MYVYIYGRGSTFLLVTECMHASWCGASTLPVKRYFVTNSADVPLCSSTLVTYTYVFSAFSHTHAEKQVHVHTCTQTKNQRTHKI